MDTEQLLSKRTVVRVGVAVLIVCIVLRAWDAIIMVLGTVLAAAAPLLAGAVIAYVVNILMSFLERHFLPRSSSPVIANLRTPLSMVVAFLLIVAFIILTASLLVPAFIESFDMIGTRAKDAIDWLRGYPPAQPVISTINSFSSGDILADLSNSKVSNFLKQGLSGAMGPITDQLALVATSISTFFFGLLFSVWLLLDKHRVSQQVRHMLRSYLGDERYARLAHVCSVLDRSYHGYIVRQCAEAAMLGALSVAILTLLGFPYALGISGLVMFSALIPVVGIPIGVCVGAFLVLTDTPWHGIIYLLAMFASQSLVETFAMPHVGDKRILISPVWVTVAVTLGGGVGGFLGMISTTPLAATIYQLLHEDVDERDAAAAAVGADGA